MVTAKAAILPRELEDAEDMTIVEAIELFVEIGATLILGKLISSQLHCTPYIFKCFDSLLFSNYTSSIASRLTDIYGLISTIFQIIFVKWITLDMLRREMWMIGAVLVCIGAFYAALIRAEGIKKIDYIPKQLEHLSVQTQMIVSVLFYFFDCFSLSIFINNLRHRNVWPIAVVLFKTFFMHTMVSLILSLFSE